MSTHNAHHEQASSPGQLGGTHDIFEGTEQIQQLFLSRAISGMRME